MRERVPRCPYCRTKVYVVLDKKGVQVGTLFGAIVGAGAGYVTGGGRAAAILRSVAAAKPQGAAFVLLMALLTGCLTGAKVGSAIGRQVDSNIRIRYRCNYCTRTFKG